MPPYRVATGFAKSEGTINEDGIRASGRLGCVDLTANKLGGSL